VQLYAVSDSESGEPLGLSYLDMFPREGKYNHFAYFAIIPGKLLAGGTSLIVGRCGTFVFDPSVAAGSASTIAAVAGTGHAGVAHGSPLRCGRLSTCSFATEETVTSTNRAGPISPAARAGFPELGSAAAAELLFDRLADFLLQPCLP